MAHSDDNLNNCVLVLTHLAKDAAHIAKVLAAADIECTVCASVEVASARVTEAGMILITEEILASKESGVLQQAVTSQPSWSAIPIVALYGGNSVRNSIQKKAEHPLLGFADLNFLPRPTSAATLVNAVKAALKERKRQFEIKALLDQLKTAKEDAERANQTKSFFLANMSHEIRTPLGAILGFTDLLKDRNLSANERDQFLDTISRNGKGLTRIIDDILDLAKVESGKLDVEQIEFSFFDMLDEVIDLFRERTKAKGLYLRMHMAQHIPNRISSDPTRLRQIFINILGNAVKFTDEGGVTIEVSADVLPNGRLNFTVEIRDTGLGIAPEQRARLFKPFSQADNTTSRKYGGTGLGLVLSERLAKALGGNIRIDDTETGHGSKFTVNFIADSVQPRDTSADIEALKKARAQDGELPLRSVRILLADDSKDNLFLVTRILTKAGAVVTTAENGAKAYQAALADDFDIVLMDIQMPEMDGHQATRALRAAGFQKPIIALTAHAMAEERALTLASGCDGHLTKPINRSELVVEITRFARAGQI